MTKLTDLSKFIYENDTKGFLVSYLVLLQNGYSLSVPLETNLQSIKEGWEQILSRLSRNFEDAFLDELSKLWIRIIRKEKGQITQDFPAKLLAHLGVDPKGEALSSVIPKKEDIIARPVDYRSKMLAEGIETQISEDYYGHQSAVQTAPPSAKTSEKGRQQAIAKDDPHGFLVHHLAKAKRDELPEVPISTVLSIITSKWEAILFSSLQLSPSETFIHTLSSMWFNAVNQKGLPRSLDHYLDLYHHFLATYKGPPKKPPPSAKSFLSSLFRRKQS